ncbi:unnamed protein product, partial [Mesorhabditis spiculigera]
MSRSSSSACELPAVAAHLPKKVQLRIIAIWQKRDPHASCEEQKRKTRLILLNLPAHLRAQLQPPPFRCEMPHFVHRLEQHVQTEIQKIWVGYHDGQPCFEQVDRQLAVLQANEISLGSFRYPPAKAFDRLELLQKFRRASVA